MRTHAARTAVILGAALALALPGTAHADEPDGPERRTETSTSTARVDGSRAVTLFAGPVQLRRGAEWVPVDLTLVTSPDGVVRPAASEHDLALTPAGPVVHWAGGGSAALAPVAPGPLPAPELAGHRATYPQVVPGYDLVVEATRSGFAASIRRAGTAVGPTPVLALATTAAGAERVVEGTATESAVSRVVASAPVTGTAPAPFDTTVQSTILRSDASGDPDLRLGSYDGTAVARSFLTFDLAEVTGRPITTATLRVHQEWSSSCRPASWEVWSSPAVGPATRFANQPVAERVWATSTETRGNSAACAAGWTQVDVTELVRAWSAAGVPTGTVLLRATDEVDPLGWKRFGSAESPQVPNLEIGLG
ncbi:DNRLRE domain-containing protein [Pseudonocardia broussonetiae]|uniref:DNRLRE domain-containing protein n=1 Tax=Pseudonocardia broussonetiae TaxID=2736640 RepID=A0A6M6JQ75_9PSEU|nr:DNRLRE domain-containing protein [Pseudonocardia broussonetiae]QJY48441.1 DNRLRE domain-containing protein [Pseudonocardia broussonetiae]